jgi:hypothetical protein
MSWRSYLDPAKTWLTCPALRKFRERIFQPPQAEVTAIGAGLGNQEIINRFINASTDVTVLNGSLDGEAGWQVGEATGSETSSLKQLSLPQGKFERHWQDLFSPHANCQATGFFASCTFGIR